MIKETNPLETQEWCDALHAVLQAHDPARVQFILLQLQAKATALGVSLPPLVTHYINTISTKEEAQLPVGDEVIATRLDRMIRWNAAMMVLRATSFAPELGGHIASYASIATLYEVGYNYFFHAANAEHDGDLVYFQGHSSPGNYARSFLEGCLSETQLSAFRQEVKKAGLSSYPHPYLMPDYWQFPTVSMGLGPIQAIFQARFLKYLHNRGLKETADRHVWCFCGDGEMDEPESLGAITVAAREQLDNLIFVVNCNLQRLDGPVRGNGKIIQELEMLFRGAGWHVIKVVWGRQWDPLLANDKTGALVNRMNEVVDGEYQAYRANDGAYIREHFFGVSEELKALVADLSDDEIFALTRGGLDPQKVFAAYTQAVKQQGQGKPTLILAKTVKGYLMGDAGESQNVAHNQKKMTQDQVKSLRDRLALPISDHAAEQFAFYTPPEDSSEIQFLKQRRAALGGSFPTRRKMSSETLPVPELAVFNALLAGSNDRELSTTMAFVRLLGILLKDKTLGPRIVPIVPDESRTFGMEGLFRQVGIYSSVGQLYKPVDASQVMYYREDSQGQILQEGLNEGGAFCSWLAASTSYSTNDYPMIPFYIYYSMFGFQRIGDLAWAAGDSQARGFLLGGTAGRTTLAGEGLQHQDGQSLLFASTIPNCVSYDPTFAYELAVIIHHGLTRMLIDQDNVFYYITVMNENYQQPAMPDGVEAGIIQGMYLYQEAAEPQIQLLGSGCILREVLQAAQWLDADFGVRANIWSVTSFNELARQAASIERSNRLNNTEDRAYVTACLSEFETPVLAATDYIRMQADQIRGYIPNPYTVLGTDGFGCSDTRKQLRDFFEVSAAHIAYAAVKQLVDQGTLKKKTLNDAKAKYGINA